MIIKTVHSSCVFFDCVLSGYSYNLPHSHTLDIGISGPYEQISDDEQGYLSQLPDSHTLDTGISDPYGQIYDELQC